MTGCVLQLLCAPSFQGTAHDVRQAPLLPTCSPTARTAGPPSHLRPQPPSQRTGLPKLVQGWTHPTPTGWGGLQAHGSPSVRGRTLPQGESWVNPGDLSKSQIPSTLLGAGRPHTHTHTHVSARDSTGAPLGSWNSRAGACSSLLAKQRHESSFWGSHGLQYPNFLTPALDFGLTSCSLVRAWLGKTDGGLNPKLRRLPHSITLRTHSETHAESTTSARLSSVSLAGAPWASGQRLLSGGPGRARAGHTAEGCSSPPAPGAKQRGP